METVLVVDDETVSLELLTETLGAEGYRVLPADSGELALASVAAQSPDLILTDVRMPRMDGFEFCRRLKVLKGSISSPLIFMSAAMDVRARVEGLALGAADFISKPVQREELLARVRTHLELGRLRGHLETQVARRTAELNAAVRQLRREIADRTRAEEALMESEERFRNLADTAPVLMWVAAPDKLCTFFNKSWLDFTGRTLQQELGNGWTESVHPDDLDRCLSIFLSSFDARRNFKMEYRLRRSDGEYRWVHNEGVPRFQPGGGFRGYVGSCIDVTDLRRALQADLVRERLNSLQLLAGGIAHDFTNLMGSILATVELAETEIADGSSPGEEIQTIKTATTQAVEMARGLMTYAGQDREKIELVDLSSLVEDMADILKGLISKRCVLKSDLPKKLPRIWGNPTHIRQIVMNLIINASEAIGDTSGTIYLRTSQAGDERGSDLERSNMLPEGGYLRLEVSDTGCGMTDEQRTRIFDPFFTTKGRGSGLGLAVVKGVVHSHGGVINVASEPRRGTTFEIFLPCVEEHSTMTAVSGK
jgi:PAS domain S-box-containing protein